MTGVARPKKAIAYKAINLVDNISRSASRVAGGLIDHYNRKDGQCDPGVDRQATMHGMNRTTVMRATAELVAAGLFSKISHGGKSHRTKYEPQWNYFAEIVADWDRRMMTGAPPGKVAELRRSRLQDCDVNGRSSATQTHLRNPLKETLEDVEGRALTATVVPPGNAARHGKQDTEGHRQSHFLLPIKGSRSPARSQSAKEVAYRHWSSDLREHCGNWKHYAALDDAITDDMADAATDAEMRRKGGGLASILAALQDQAAA